jgi:ABC-type phosphate transport system substrate-binding protein
VRGLLSGLVTDWHDTTTPIPNLDGSGAVGSQFFSDDNIVPGNTVVSPGVAYASSSLPIKLTFRSDGSGTSFIITNFLQSVCPLLDPSDNNGYVTIFQPSLAGTKPLPNTTFANVTNNVAVFNAHRGARPAHSTANWVGYSGSPDVAINVGAGPNGALGYVSVDFTQPYTTQVVGHIGATTVTSPGTAPSSASVEDDHNRVAGQIHPNTVSPFVAPTPTSADMGFISLNDRTTTSTYQDWNLYAVQWSGQPLDGGVTINGLSRLGIPTAMGAYPIVGTTYMYLYSCYNDPDGTRVPNITNMLAWYLRTSDNSPPIYSNNTTVINRNNPGHSAAPLRILRNDGFHELNKSLADLLINTYVKQGTGQSISAVQAGSVDGCTGISGGAN